MRQKKLVRKPYRRSRWRSYLGFRGKTVWDWLPIGIAFLIPLVIALGTWRITTEQGKLEDQRAQAERELAEQRAQDEALQAYLDQMSQLILDRKLPESEPGDPVNTLAQARTSTVIARLDAEHNESVIRFLSDSGLAGRKSSAKLLKGIELQRARLSAADLSNAFLLDAELGSAHLSGALLTFADLRGANLDHANLRGADLAYANLSADDYMGFGADLSNTDLTYAHLTEANLSDAFLTEANLSGAFLTKADLSNTDLSNADLTGAEGVTNEELEQQAASLKGATMPNGQKYEDWLKSKDQ